MKKRHPKKLPRLSPDALAQALSFHQTGNLDRAAQLYNAILAINPDAFDALHYLGILHAQQGRHAEALALFRRALAINPQSAEANLNLANLFLETRRPQEAVAHLRNALAMEPGNIQALFYLGNALRDLKQYDDALQSYDAALSIQPQFFAALNNRGDVQKALHRHQDALASFERALALKPNEPGVLVNIGNTQRAAGDYAGALASYRRALALQPAFAGAHNDMGNALQDQGRLDEAIASYRAALACKPDYAQAHSNLGLALKDSNLLDEALASHRAALALKPDYAEAHNNLGLTLQDQGELDAAIASYRTALAHKPDYASAHSNLLFCLNYHPDLPAAGIFAEYQRWNEVHARPFFSPLAHPNSRDPQRRLRVGYVSPDFRRHSARHFIEPLLAHHDPAQVEVFAYAEVPSEDAVTARFKSYAAHWRRTVGLSHAEMAALIRDDAIDILVDLAGHTGSNRLQVFARRPAPLQVSWLGYGYTTGMDAIDYFVADATFAPPGCESLFAEKILRLPVFAAYRPADNMGDQGPLPALNSGAITFGTLSRSVRLNHRVIRTWAALLQRLPASRFIINSGNFRDPGMQNRVRDQFAALGIASDRLLIGFDSPPWDVLRRIDITLDCFPHNSGTTLFESLYLGVPYITLADRPSVGRLGAAVLTALGRPEWIGHSEADYIDKAATLAADLPRLAAIRAELRHDMQQSPLMNEAAFARSVEAAYREIWQQWCAEPPES